MNVLDNSVMIKGSKSGITVFLDEEMPFEELLENVSDKFKSASKFFNNANMAISFDGRNLSAEEEKRILNVISDVSELNIVCVLDENNDMKEVYEEAVKKAMASVDIPQQPVVSQPTMTDPKTTCMFYKGTLRSGQVFEADGSVVVLGDVNPGGKVVAKGSVIVLGSLKGNIFAGVDGNENAFVVALEMSPMQIKIGDIIARSSDSGVNKISKGKNKSKTLEPKIAYVYDQNIYIEDLEQNALDDISLD